MPTPDDAMLARVEHEHESPPTSHTTCPPDELRTQIHQQDANDEPAVHSSSSHHPRFNASAQRPVPTHAEREISPSAHFSAESHIPCVDTDAEAPVRDTPTPMSSSAIEEGAEEQRASHASPASSTAAAFSPWSQPSLLSASPFPSQRFLPYSSSSLLRPGSRFKGNQTSDRQQYEVEVEIKYVDTRESFLCGYLRIKGLTEDHPSLTTYFEGEIIGSKYSFITQHPEWGSNEKVDRQHWARFPAHKTLSKHSSRQELVPKDYMQKEHMFMRWKEHFLVPDHRVRTINGASFEGFYYICFNQVNGSIEGIYFHAKSEKFQKLRLEHVPDHGCRGAIEFR